MLTDGSYIYGGDHFIMYINVESVCCTPETNTILYINCTSIKINKTKFKIITIFCKSEMLVF